MDWYCAREAVLSEEERTQSGVEQVPSGRVNSVLLAEEQPWKEVGSLYSEAEGQQVKECPYWVVGGQQEFSLEAEERKKQQKGRFYWAAEGPRV